MGLVRVRVRFRVRVRVRRPGHAALRAGGVPREPGLPQRIVVAAAPVRVRPQVLAERQGRFDVGCHLSGLVATVTLVNEWHGCHRQ